MNGNWQLFDEYRRGNKTKVYLQCNEYKEIISIWSHPVSETCLGVNESLVAGCMTSGIGYSTLQETLAATGVLVMSAKTFRRYQENSVPANVKIFKEYIARSAEKEKEIAIKKNRIIMNLPYIIVIADGAWSKQTIGTDFASLGGCAVVVGFETGEIIAIVVRNIPCAICDKVERENRTPKEHNCYSNYDRTKSSEEMESEAMTEAFSTSVDKYGLVYRFLIADGDSSVLARIQAQKPYHAYGVKVKKIEFTYFEIFE